MEIEKKGRGWRLWWIAGILLVLFIAYPLSFGLLAWTCRVTHAKIPAWVEPPLEWFYAPTRFYRRLPFVGDYFDRFYDWCTGKP